MPMILPESPVAYVLLPTANWGTSASAVLDGSM